jgi:hypothetical protein
VIVTVWLKFDGFGELLRVTVAAAALTVCVSAPDEGAKFELPLYEAVNWWLPTARLEVEKLAEPPDTGTVANAVEPSKKVTVPVAFAGVIAAVKVTD